MLLSTNHRVFKEISSTTTLGLLRNPTIDNFQVKNNTTQVQPTNFTASTKRKVLATTESIFDPLGLLSPAVIAYKIFLQKLWQDKLQWDELLPAHLQQEIHKQLQQSQGQQAINYPLHTRFRPGSNLLCEDGTTNFLCTGNKEFNGKTRGCSQQFS